MMLRFEALLRPINHVLVARRHQLDPESGRAASSDRSNRVLSQLERPAGKKLAVMLRCEGKDLLCSGRSGPIGTPHLPLGDHMHQLDVPGECSRTERNPSIGRVMRLVVRRSCSTTLFRYLTWRMAMRASRSAVRSCALLGWPGCRQWLLNRVRRYGRRPSRRSALPRSCRAGRAARSMKSMILPTLSTARDRYFHWPRSRLSLAHAPAIARRALAMTKYHMQCQQQFERPAVHGRVID